MTLEIHLIWFDLACPFPKPVNLDRGILDAIPDDEFKQLAENHLWEIKE